MIDNQEVIEAILYSSEEEKQSAWRRCMEEAIKTCDSCHHFSVDELESLIADFGERSLESEIVISDFYFELMADERIKLFQLACERFGYKLWNGKAWKNKTCKRNCPLADYCKKETVELNGERLCRGQIYSRGIDTCMADSLPKDTPIYDENGHVHFRKSDYEEAFGNFFDFSMDMLSFGSPKRGGSQIEGGNVIWQLYKKVLSETDDK